RLVLFLELEQDVASFGVLLDHLEPGVDANEPHGRGPRRIARVGERLLRARVCAARREQEAQQDAAHGADDRRRYWAGPVLRAFHRSWNETQRVAKPAAPHATYHNTCRP